MTLPRIMYWVLVSGLAVLTFDAANQLYRMIDLRRTLGSDIAAIQPASGFLEPIAFLLLSLAALYFLPRAAKLLIERGS